jgi:hypothetical protein
MARSLGIAVLRPELLVLDDLSSELGGEGTAEVKYAS